MRTLPIVPEDLDRNGSGVRPLVRACITTGLTAVDRRSGSAADHIRRLGWTDDRDLALVLRAATTPSSLTNTPQLARMAYKFLDTLVGISAGADLLARGIRLDFADYASITMPTLALPSPGVGFVGEGAPIPVTTATSSAGVTLSPHKFAALSSLTREMMESSNAEVMIRAVLVESSALALDAALFSANAGASDRPPGLLYNVTPLPAAAAGGEKAQIIVDDLQAIAAAVAPVAGNSEIVLVASSDAAVALRLRLPSPVQWPVLVSSALPAKTLIAVAAAALVSAIQGTPLIDASSVAEFHRETVPAPIVTSAGVVATPVGSLYQTDQIALRLRWPLSWALRDARGIAWMTNVNW
jgi:hypothetical protein